MNPLEETLRSVPGIRGAQADLLERLGLRTVGELFFHFPRAYEDLTDVRAMAKLSAGALQTVVGEVVELDSRPECWVRNTSKECTLILYTS